MIASRSFPNNSRTHPTTNVFPHQELLDTIQRFMATLQNSSFIDTLFNSSSLLLLPNPTNRIFKTIKQDVHSLLAIYGCLFGGATKEERQGSSGLGSREQDHGTSYRCGFRECTFSSLRYILCLSAFWLFGLQEFSFNDFLFWRHSLSIPYRVIKDIRVSFQA